MSRAVDVQSDSRFGASLRAVTSRFVAILVRHRILATWVVFIALVVEDVFFGFRPRDPFDFQSPACLLALSLIVFGLALRSWAAGILQKNRELADAGPYALVRHPLYLGSFLLVFGFCTMLNDYENHLVILFLAAVVYRAQIHKEELRLSQEFGPVWSDYAAKVPRLTPRRLLVPGAFAGWRFSQWVANHEYRAATAAVVALLGVKHWHDA